MPDLLAALPVPIGDQIAEVERELGMRQQVYPGRVAAGTMKQDRADLQIGRMRAVLATLREVQARGEQR